MTKTKMGRPVLPSYKRRSVRVQVGLRPEEAAKVQAAADAAGLPVGSLARKLLLGAAAGPTADGLAPGDEYRLSVSGSQPGEGAQS